MVIGICAYNEENNVGRLLQNLVSEQDLGENCKILVICSGCNDRTPQIVRRFQENDARIELVIENLRRGKANALNKIFKMADGTEFAILINADALPEKGSINKLVTKLADLHVGAAFAQPVPVRNPRGVCHEIAHLVWRLHHIISLSGTPKLSGELCAIRSAYVQEIPENAATDEPYLERAIRKQDKEILYVPQALVYVRCPTNIVDLIKQRKRIWIGHIQLRETTGYKVSTSSLGNIFRAAPSLKPIEIPYLLLGGFMEMISYIQARAAFSKGNVPFAWEPIRSTKDS
jgi:cellulose synthase/poly-beta-1,6-N-acetylglucosamine synthase-like glycosyltransferase